METFVHPSSIIGSDVVLEKGCYIGPFCSLEGEVRIASGTKLESHVYIAGGKITIGQNNTIYPFVTIGGIPQDLSAFQAGNIKIGSRNRIWQGVTIHSSVSEEGVTSIGDDNFIMTQVHIAHDCLIKNNIILTAMSGLAGHVIIDDYANIGGMSAVVQKIRIGMHAFSVAQSLLTHDLWPYMLYDSQGALRGVNLVGLRRRDFSKESIQALMDFAKNLRSKKYTSLECIQKSQENFGKLSELDVLEKFYLDRCDLGNLF